MNSFIEKISPVERTTPGIYLLNTMSREAKLSDLLEHFKIERVKGESVKVEVELKINGVPVNFSKSVEEMWERMLSSYNKDVLEKAKELISKTRFDGLNRIMDSVEYQMQCELEKLFPEIINEEDV